MFEKVKKTIAETLKIDPSLVTMDTDISKDLKADSLAVVEMLFTLEDELGIIIPDEEVAKMNIVGNLVSYLEKTKK